MVIILIPLICLFLIFDTSTKYPTLYFFNSVKDYSGRIYFNIFLDSVHYHMYKVAKLLQSILKKVYDLIQWVGINDNFVHNYIEK